MDELSPRMEAVLAYLAQAERAGKKSIRRATGAGENTLVALRSRGLISRSSSGSYRLTTAGREEVPSI